MFKMLVRLETKVQPTSEFPTDLLAVHHFGKFAGEGKFEAGQEAHLQIDEKRRKLNARLHSAGHLLDVVVKKLGQDWVPGKG